MTAIRSMWRASAVSDARRRTCSNIIDALTEKGVTLISHKEKIDTDTPTGKFMLTVFAALSQLERKQLKQRQREGIEIAKAQGKYTGRKPIPTDWTRFGQLYGEWRAKDITGRDFMRRMDMSANTFYRRVREYEINHRGTSPSRLLPDDSRQRNGNVPHSRPSLRSVKVTTEKKSPQKRLHSVSESFAVIVCRYGMCLLWYAPQC